MSKLSAINDEADFIQRYLAPLAKNVAGSYGLNDDAATLDVGEGYELVATVDAVAAGVHFFADDAAADIAWKALAVNVSDLVAKGAEPLGYLMSLAFPEPPSPDWMTGFSGGLGAAQSVFKIELAGGDTDVSPGPLSITITALGRVPKGKIVRRSGAGVGDVLFLTGTIGDAGVGLALRQDEALKSAWKLGENESNFLLNRYHRPKPRTRLAPVLQRYASASIDISDGLVKDAGSLARASGAGVNVNCAALPISEPTRLAVAGGVAAETLLTAGGDYEVLATVPADQTQAFAQAAEVAGVAVTEIGTMTEDQNIVFAGPDDAPLVFQQTGYDHFS